MRINEKLIKIATYNRIRAARKLYIPKKKSLNFIQIYENGYESMFNPDLIEKIIQIKKLRILITNPQQIKFIIAMTFVTLDILKH